MPKVIRADEIRTLADYEAVRAEMKKRAVALRRQRRVELNGRLAVVFENRDTVLFQIHETMRAEGIRDPQALQAECDIYATMLPRPDALCAAVTLHLAPGESPGDVRQRLHQLEQRMALLVGGEVVFAEPLTGLTMGDNGTAKKYVRFRLNDEQRARLRDQSAEVRVRFDHPELRAEGVIGAETRWLLAEDMA